MGLAAGSKRLELTLLEELASGTFARVYLAEARGAGGVDRIVAVKVLREKWAESEEILARTRDEARLLGRLRHKNIVRVEELTDFDGQPAIIMEYVEGMNLQQMLDALKARGQRFPARAALEICVASASALDAAYRRVPYGMQEPLRVIHRDVKPSNIMVSIDAEVKVLDFGTARASSPLRSAKTGMLRFGSWKYMSPERKEGSRGDHSADIYSLGLLLVELLANDWIKGLAVSPGEHDAQLHELVSGLQDVGMPNDAWSMALKDLILQMSSFSPDQRPSAQQLSEVLSQYCEQAGGKPLQALATDLIAESARGKGKPGVEGSLSGTRLYVSLDGSVPPTAHRVGTEPAAPPPPHPHHTHPHPRNQPVADPIEQAETNRGPSPGHYAYGNDVPAQGGFGSPAQPAPEPQATPAPAPFPGHAPAQPAYPSRAAQAQPAYPSPTASPAPFQPATADPHETDWLPPPDAAPHSQGPIASGPVAGGPVAPAPAAEPARKKSKLPLILLGLVLLVVLCGGVPAAAWVAWSMLGSTSVTAPDAITDVAPDPVEPPAVPDEPEPDAGSFEPAVPPVDPAPRAEVAPLGVSVSVQAADRLIQRIQLVAVDGDVEQSSRGSLAASVPPGRYLLTIKVAGRSPMAKELDVSDRGLDLLCAPDEKMVKVLCKNADGDITLALTSE